MESCSKTCQPCFKKELNIEATKYCNFCLERYCDSCSASHKAQKATRNHYLIHIDDIELKFVKSTNCDPCLYNGNIITPKFQCETCDESYCDACARTHKYQKATRSHEVIPFQGQDARTTCEACSYNGDKTNPAASKCTECDEVLCAACVKVHNSLRATRNHTVKDMNNKSIFEKSPSTSATSKSDFKSYTADQDNLCDICKATGQLPDSATSFCFTCRKALCQSCSDDHKMASATNHHQILLVRQQIGNVDALSKKKKEEYNDENTSIADQMLPGKPAQVGALKVDRVTITWNPPKCLLDSYAYQIRYRRNESSKWEYNEDKTTHTTSTIKRLQSHSTYVFQVRMVNNETEGPYSDISDEIDTLPSAAELVMHLSVEDNQPGRPLRMRNFKLNECISARNQNFRTRKLILGDGTQYAGKEKTILLLGATGTGKSTFVDAIVNFIFGIKFADQFRFKVVNYEEDETKIYEDKGKTRWITCYTIFPTKGSMIDFKLTIIDTPGFGDKGIEEDELIKTQLKELFSAVDEKGVLFVDAVCIFMKATDARLTVSQQYIYTTITSLFHRDIEENMCSVITFSDGKTPPVLSALREANLPFESYYPFNTTDMFSDNSQTLQNDLTKELFELNLRSFGSLLDKVKALQTKRLSKSIDVLIKRQHVDHTAERLLVEVDLGLVKIENVQKELTLLEHFKTEMIENKNFTYKTRKKIQTLIPLETGKHTTNCLHCNTSCCNCDEDLAQCVAMKDGYCTVCEDKCFWREHKNTPFIIEWNEIEETCVYAEIKEKFGKAKGEVLEHEATVIKMKKELDEIEEGISNIMQDIVDCKNELSKIAVCAKPLRVSEHIEILIENEKWTRKPGFQDRINILVKLKRRVTVEQVYEEFRRIKEHISA